MNYKNQLDNINNLSEGAIDIVNQIVSLHCADLDKLINQIQSVLLSNEDDLTDEELDKILLSLPVMLYSLSDKQEFLGIKEDVSNMVTKEYYNKAYLEYEGKVGEKTIYAEDNSKEQLLISSLIGRAYKIIKSRIEAGYELLNSVKKIVNRRISYADMKGDIYGRN